MRDLAWAGSDGGGRGAPGWNSTKIGPFLVFSELGVKETRARAAELEQFRFSLGELLGRRDLTIDPPLQLFLFRQPRTDAPPVTTRTGAIALVQGDGALTAENRKALARILLDRNIGRMPAAVEQGLETFLSTTELQGAKVVWGATPPEAQRDANWAMIDWLVTNPDTYGSFRVLLANIEKSVDEDVAYRNALHKSRSEVEREVQAYVRGGQFRTIDGPSRPLSPERDLAIRAVDPDDVTLHLADLLDAQSEQRYKALLASGKNRAEAEEGLGFLYARRNDLPRAAEFFSKAIAEGSKNAYAMVEYARIEPDEAKARAALEKAVAADPNSAEAHFFLGRKLADPAKQIEQWNAAVKLAPRRQEYWVALAQALAAQKQWPEASKAWRGAEQAAATPEEREKMMAARLAIEEQRLDFEDAEHRRKQDEETRETNRLKQNAIAEIRAAEAKVNQGSDPDAGVNAVPWDQLDGAEQHVDGQMVRVECVGRAQRIWVRTADGKLIKLNAGAAGLPKLTCGAQPERGVSVAYSAKPNARTGVAGDMTSLQYR